MKRDGCDQHAQLMASDAVLSVQILYAKQGLRVKRRLTRANVKEKVKEMRRILAKLRFMAKEVQLPQGLPVSEQEREQARRRHFLPSTGNVAGPAEPALHTFAHF